MSMPRIVIVTGSRDWKGSAARIALVDALNQAGPDVVVHGGALGADSMAHSWCKMQGKIAIVYFPDYDAYGNSAPLKRNIAMLEAYPTALVVACPLPSSRGTIHTMNAAKSRGMQVEVVNYE